MKLVLSAGKNRPLDEDELDFVERVLDQERQKDRSVRADELAALDKFQQASHALWCWNAAPCRPAHFILLQATPVCPHSHTSSILSLVHTGVPFCKLGAVQHRLIAAL